MRCDSCRRGVTVNLCVQKTEAQTRVNTRQKYIDNCQSRTWAHAVDVQQCVYIPCHALPAWRELDATSTARLLVLACITKAQT